MSEHTFAECSSCLALNKVSIPALKEKKPVCGKCGSSLKLHGLVAEVSTKNFEKIIRTSTLPVVVDFWASWCGPCRSYAPEYERASLANPGTVFLKVNTETEQQVSAAFNIRGIPCTILFKDGQEIRRQSGAMSAEQVRAFIG